MRAVFAGMVLGTLALGAEVDPYEGLWQGYDGEWGHVSRQLIALAEAFPAEKFSWRPASGVRSTSEVFMHIALANFYRTDNLLLRGNDVPRPRGRSLVMVHTRPPWWRSRFVT